MTKWTEKMRETVRKMWAEGATYKEIGAELGITRDAAGSLVAWLGLPTRCGKPRVLRPKGTTYHAPSETREVLRVEAYWSRPPDERRLAAWERARKGAREALRA